MILISIFNSLVLARSAYWCLDCFNESLFSFGNELQSWLVLENSDGPPDRVFKNRVLEVVWPWESTLCIVKCPKICTTKLWKIIKISKILDKKILSILCFKSNSFLTLLSGHNLRDLVHLYSLLNNLLNFWKKYLNKFGETEVNEFMYSFKKIYIR